MAEVYRGELLGARGTSRPIAIKRLAPHLRQDPNAVELFVCEAKLHLQLNHPSIIQAIELGHDDRGYYLICELLDCINLNQLIKKAGKLSTQVVVSIANPVIEALHHIHTESRNGEGPIVHRDVNPNNIFLTRQGTIKLGDFGIAAHHQLPQTQALATCGTPGFAAPEQESNQSVDPRADVYGLGATLDSLLDESVDETIQAILQKATSDEPNQRHETIRELGQALEAIIHPEPGCLMPLVQWIPAAPEVLESKSLDVALQSLVGGSTLPGDTNVKPVHHAPSQPKQSLLLPAILTAVGILGVGAWVGLSNNAHDEDPVQQLSVSKTPPPRAIDKKPPPPPNPPPQPTVQIKPAVVRTTQKPVPKMRQGIINLNSQPWATIWIDDIKIGNTPLRSHLLAEGVHTIRLENSGQKLKRSFEVKVSPKSKQTLIVDLVSGHLKRRQD